MALQKRPEALSCYREILKNIEGTEKEEELVIFEKIGKIMIEEQAVSLLCSNVVSNRDDSFFIKDIQSAGPPLARLFDDIRAC